MSYAYSITKCIFIYIDKKFVGKKRKRTKTEYTQEIVWMYFWLYQMGKLIVNTIYFVQLKMWRKKWRKIGTYWKNNKD